ncbi:GGDEF domain-containing protein [Enterobacteriaceae bacterium H20N1]|uniref:diguanylate cyclase n=1 Tax=Dryocola boscaweniae TaxID=2925397 RepID=A0A9X3ABA6_9ENTR|nr:GGDEF domain-containing protein [Dryocola boscaweniae]MCT4700638.1 GGDEF domain-containing protein [Dryocola boscaweniae]MCT4717758.1 GGDEF domain-containing protein [Dryocola boscaweniae]
MVFGKIRTLLKAVIDDYILQLARVNFRETPEYHALLVRSTRSALSSAIRWLWLVGVTCSSFILTQREILSLEGMQSNGGPLSEYVHRATLFFLVLLLVFALLSRFHWAKHIGALKNNMLAAGFAFLGCYWGLVIFFMSANQQIIFSMSLYFILIFSSLAALYVSALCLYSFVVPVTLLPLIAKLIYFPPVNVINVLGVFVALFLVETGRRMLSHWFIQAIRQEYTNQTYAAALDEIAHSDPLTRIANRRQFDGRLNKLITLAPLSNTPPTVILIDVDYFKKYNDRYGHLMGDECLVSVTQALTRAVRNAGDLVARYGGEEFVVVLSDVTLERAQDIAVRIKTEINSLAIPHAASDVADHVTISQGIAQWRPGESVEKLLSRADSALYRSKEQGRNRFSVAD